MIEKSRYFTIFQQMGSMDDGNPMDTLIKLQMKKGIDEKTAQANALHCMSAVAGREALFAQVSEDAMGPMNRLFEKLAEKDPGQRLEALRRIHFGLTADPADGPRSTDEIETLYRQYAAGHPLTAEELEDEIRQALGQYRISPAAMRVLARKLKNSEGSAATAMALGESGRNLKCLMTMELWLDSNGTMTMEEAANNACTSADYQAVADAVSKGYMARSAVRVLLVVIAIVAVLYAASCFTGVFDSLMMAAEGLAAAPASTAATAASTAAETVHHSGRCLVNYGSLYNPTPMDHLGYAIGDGLKGLLAFFAAEAITSRSAENLVGAAASWLSGLFHSGRKSAAAMEAMADIMEDGVSVRETKAPARTNPLHAAPSLSVEEEDEDANPVLF